MLVAIAEIASSQPLREVGRHAHASTIPLAQHVEVFVQHEFRIREELRSAAAAISDAADWLTKMFSGEPQAEDAPASLPEPELTLEQVRAVLADKSRQGHTAEIRALLQKYGASKLSQIDPAHYKALLAEAEVLTNGS